MAMAAMNTADTIGKPNANADTTTKTVTAAVSITRRRNTPIVI